MVIILAVNIINMDKKVAALIKDTMGKGEKVAPVKSKLKVKFQKAKDKALKGNFRRINGCIIVKAISF